MARSPLSRLALVALALVPVVLVGCTSGGSGRSLFSQGHRLLETTKEIRWANAGPLQVPRELEKEPLPPYVVEPGDVLLILPVELDSPARLPGDQPVLPDGTINLGKYGRLVVAGKTVGEIEVMVRAAVLAQTKDAGFISVRLISRVSKVFYVVGEVNAPGAFQLAGRESVLDAIMAAGGLTDNASHANIVLSRPTKPNCCRVVLPVCFDQIVQLGDTTTNYQIAPGDRIYVPSRTLCESIFRNCKWNKTPCCCNSSHTPCPIPEYVGGPCPEPFCGKAGAPVAAPITGPVAAPAAEEVSRPTLNFDLPTLPTPAPVNGKK